VFLLFRLDPEREWVTYELTALSPLGVQYLASFNEEHYREKMEEWERALVIALSRNS
jgi:hypothetical protein